ncbi:Essential protein Yae1 [Macleaya cordata]|uniref:Essential protein Yae1 n=1 Tax=Macleaya cordata TaxID=56857 RepID=A0A200PLT2_MACCD|nr:Essential protein Yae1 [Macleaya cordata]
MAMPTTFGVMMGLCAVMILMSHQLKHPKNWTGSGKGGTANSIPYPCKNVAHMRIGYRDGLTSAREASTQEGFNIGFKESVLVGYKWGLIRGVSSALACLSDGLKEKLVENIEAREKLQILYESVNSVSTKDALDLYGVEIFASKSKEHCKCAEGKSTLEIVPDEISSCSQLGSYSLELESLLQSSVIQVHSAVG